MEHLQSKLIEFLIQDGWTGDRIRKDVVTKDFDTAVGHKQAVAWCRPCTDADRFAVTGEYWSEGRNVLSTCFVWIPFDSDDASALEAVSRFIMLANAAIDESYARRLLLQRGQ